MKYLFVYGSLRKGHEPPEIAETAENLKLVGAAYVFADLFDFGKFTGLLLGGQNKLFGQILKLPEDPKTLQKLDEYEGFYQNDLEKSLFRRVKTIAYLADETLETWVYEYNGNNFNLQSV